MKASETVCAAFNRHPARDVNRGRGEKEIVEWNRLGMPRRRTYEFQKRKSVGNPKLRLRFKLLTSYFGEPQSRSACRYIPKAHCLLISPRIQPLRNHSSGHNDSSPTRVSSFERLWSVQIDRHIRISFKYIPRLSLHCHSENHQLFIQPMQIKYSNFKGYFSEYYY